MMGPSPRPLLYMNLHESAFPGGNAFNEMGQAMTTMGLSGVPWAVFDVHHYFSWGGAHGAGIPAANCSTDAELTRCNATDSYRTPTVLGLAPRTTLCTPHSKPITAGRWLFLRLSTPDDPSKPRHATLYLVRRLMRVRVRVCPRAC